MIHISKMATEEPTPVYLMHRHIGTIAYTHCNDIFMKWQKRKKKKKKKWKKNMGICMWHHRHNGVWLRWFSLTPFVRLVAHCSTLFICSCYLSLSPFLLTSLLAFHNLHACRGWEQKTTTTTVKICTEGKPFVCTSQMCVHIQNI